MADTPIQKICVVCGKDVSKQKRTKDRQGRYYCEPCFKEKSSPATVGSRTASDDWAALADLAKGSIQPDDPLVACASCGSRIRCSQVDASSGSSLCRRCALKLKQQTDSQSQRKAPSRVVPVMNTWGVAAVIVIALIILIPMIQENNKTQQNIRKMDVEISASERNHDKAEEMRSHGMSGSDEELSRTYDRAKSVDDTKDARRDRLRQNK